MKKNNTMKKLCLIALLTLLVATLFCVAINAETYSGTCGADGDNLTWSLDTATGELTIDGEGEMANYTITTNAPWYNYRTSIKTVIIENIVTSIGAYAFSGCSSLTSVTIPNSVTSIGNGAFYDCTNLTSVTIPDSVMSIGENAFNYCTSLTSVNIPDRVASIDYGAFSYCENLTSVNIPDRVTSIGAYAFIGCTSLTNVTIPNSVTSIGVLAFEDCTSLTSVNIPDRVTNIGGSAFAGCSSLTSVTIGNGVASIGESTFSGCTSLTSVNIPDGVTTIGRYAFFGCRSLTSVTIPDRVTSIGESTFSGCSSLTNVYIPDRVTNIGGSAFAGCSSLTSAVIPDSVASIGDEAFYGCSSLTSVTIGESVKSIGNDAFISCDELVEVINKSSLNITKGTSNYGYVAWYAFEVHDGESKIVNRNGYLFYTYEGVNYLLGYIDTENALVLPENYNGQNYEIYQRAFDRCNNLTSVTIPNSVTSIGYRAFYGCSSLTNVVIPDSVTSIDYMAFNSCSNLTSVTIGNSVTSIGAYAFEDCTGLTSVMLLSKTATIFDSNDTIYSGATIYGYAGSTAEAYATKYDRSFVALEEPADADFISYQVTKGENGTFSLRAIAGLNSLDYANFGYEVTITTKDESGNDVVKTRSGATTKAYSSIFGGTTEYSIKEHFGYEYAGLATVTNLAIDSSYTKLEIRTFVTTMGGEVKYGKSGTLLYTGVLDENEFPSLELVTE